MQTREKDCVHSRNTEQQQKSSSKFQSHEHFTNTTDQQD